MSELAETATSTRRIYEGRVINLRVDHVTLPNGKESTREVVEHRGAVAMVPILPNGDVVLVRQYRHATGGILLEIPAGSLNIGEEPLECAHRELAEEVKYKAESMVPLFSIFMAPGYTTEKIHVFAATGLAPSFADTDDDEFLDIATMTLDSAIAAIDDGTIDDAKSVSSLLYVRANFDRLTNK